MSYILQCNRQRHVWRHHLIFLNFTKYSKFRLKSLLNIVYRLFLILIDQNIEHILFSTLKKNLKTSKISRKIIIFVMVIFNNFASNWFANFFLTICFRNIRQRFVLSYWIFFLHIIFVELYTYAPKLNKTVTRVNVKVENFYFCCQ